MHYAKAALNGLLKVLAFLFGALLALLKLLGRGWKALLRKCYEWLTDLPAENPSLFDVLAALHIRLKGLPKQKRRIAYAAILVAVLLAGTLVGSLLSSLAPSSSDSSGGVFISTRKPFQPEFSKLDCLTCKGDGDCNTCGGYGEVDRYAGGGDTVRSKCSSCYGSGNCRTCGGSGKR